MAASAEARSLTQEQVIIIKDYYSAGSGANVNFINENGEFDFEIGELNSKYTSRIRKEEYRRVSFPESPNISWVYLRKEAQNPTNLHRYYFADRTVQLIIKKGTDIVLFYLPNTLMGYDPGSSSEFINQTKDQRIVNAINNILLQYTLLENDAIYQKTANLWYAVSMIKLYFPDVDIQPEYEHAENIMRRIYLHKTSNVDFNKNFIIVNNNRISEDNDEMSNITSNEKFMRETEAGLITLFQSIKEIWENRERASVEHSGGRSTATKVRVDNLLTKLRRKYSDESTGLRKTIEDLYKQDRLSPERFQQIEKRLNKMVKKLLYN